MTTRSGARVYRGQPRRLAAGACPQCGRNVHVHPVTLIRRTHRDLSTGVECGGSRMRVGDRPSVALEVLPPVTFPVRRVWSGAPAPADGAPDPRVCSCGWRPKRKKDGAFAAHRTRPDDPSAPYCPDGAPRSKH